MSEDDLWSLYDLLAKDGVDDETLAVLGDDVQAGEFVVALEQLADTILEHDIEIGDLSGQLLRRLGEHYRISRSSFVELASRFTVSDSSK